MNSEQIQFNNHQLILRVKQPSIFVLIFSFGFATFFTLFPIAILILISSLNNGENPIKFLTIFFLSIPFFFGLFLFRILIWNYLGKEIYNFNDDKINFIADFGYFKDGKREISSENIQFQIIPKGYENENKGVLVINSNEEIIES